MSEFLQRVEGEIQNRRLISRGQKILVAVSGGVDSMALLHALNAAAGRGGWRLSVAHFNHRLRGRASDADERLVQRTAKQLSLKYHSDQADVKSFAASSKISIEMAARKLRHEFLARVAREQKIPMIALAHHADDQVELFFLRLLRGAGGEGLAGMKWISPSPADEKIKLIRPLLACTKFELLEYARANKIAFRDDASNFSADFLRNRIRNELLPLLQNNYQPGLTKTVLRTMEIAGAETQFVSAAAQVWLADQSKPFESLSGALQRKILQQQLTAIGVGSEFELIEELRAKAGKLINISPALAVMRDADGKVHFREMALPAKFIDEATRFRLKDRAGEIGFGGRKIRWRFAPQETFVRPQLKSGVELFDADKVGDEIVLRHWRAGDRFQPIGMKSPVKLQDLFVNAKIPATIRRQLILATTASGKIFWVEGLRIGENFKLKPQTRRRFKWDWTKNSR